MNEFQCQICAHVDKCDEPQEVCIHCGSDDFRKICPMCSSIIDDDTKVCPECREAVA